MFNFCYLVFRWKKEVEKERIETEVPPVEVPPVADPTPMEGPPPPVPGPTDTHTTVEWTNERIEHTYANAISEMPDISDQNTMGIRGKRIEALGFA